MANFKTHLNVALMVSAGLSVMGYVHELYGVVTAVFCVAVGAIGGLLPDIDLESSRPAQKGFLLVSLFVATLLAIMYATRQTGDDVVMYALLVWGVTFIVVRYGLIGLFNRLTVHRGMVHSVPYMAMFGLLVVLGSFWGLRLTAYVSWFFGVFLFVGAMVHLVLDELYSVNILGLKLKKSSGTALKFFEKKKKWRYVLLYVVVVVLFVFTPQYQENWSAIKHLWRY